jgi:hypothetical protein
MSKWDKYKVDNVSTSNNKWQKYLVQKPVTNPEGDSWPALIGKSALKGVSSIADLPKLAASGLESMAVSKARRNPGGLYAPDFTNDEIEIPDIDIISSKIPSSEDIRMGIKNKTEFDLEPHPTTSGQRIASKGAEFAGSLLGFGGAGAASKGIGALGKLGGTGAVIGAGSGVLQEAGVDPLVSDLISSVAAPFAIAGSKNLLNNFTKPRQTLAKIPMKLMGLTPKSMNIEAAGAARDLGIDLPAAAVTDSKLTALADQYVGKAPIFGDKLKNKYALAEEQTQKVLSDIFDEIGPARTPEIEGHIAGLYDKVKTSLPADAKVLPANLKKAIDDIKINTAILSPDEKSLLQSLKTIKNEIEPASKIISQYGPIKLPLQEYDVNKLVGTKKSLNSIIKWDTDAGVKNQLKKIQKAISQDIKEYGKTNPEWYDAFKEADKLYGDVARREKLENILGHKATNYATESLSYNALAKAINNPKNSVSIRKQLTPETFKKIQKLGTVAKAMAIKSKNIPNPSGTATTGGISAAIFGLFYDPITTAKLLGGGYGATKLLTDKKFLDLALKLAENPNNLATTTALNHRIKEITGYSAIALNKNLQEMNNLPE